LYQSEGDEWRYGNFPDHFQSPKVRIFFWDCSVRLASASLFWLIWRFLGIRGSANLVVERGRITRQRKGRAFDKSFWKALPFLTEICMGRTCYWHRERLLASDYALIVHFQHTLSVPATCMELPAWTLLATPSEPSNSAKARMPAKTSRLIFMCKFMMCLLSDNACLCYAHSMSLFTCFCNT
jgi:hypothetical protein